MTMLQMKQKKEENKLFDFKAVTHPQFRLMSTSVASPSNRTVTGNTGLSCDSVNPDSSLPAGSPSLLGFILTDSRDLVAAVVWVFFFYPELERPDKSCQPHVHILRNVQ